MDRKAPETPYSDEETAKRRDEALRRALNTPPKPTHGRTKRPRADAPAPERGKPNPTDRSDAP